MTENRTIWPEKMFVLCYKNVCFVQVETWTFPQWQKVIHKQNKLSTIYPQPVDKCKNSLKIPFSALKYKFLTQKWPFFPKICPYSSFPTLVFSNHFLMKN
nr:MAG TPA: hypothetical protein [Caudoviricetes sp.]